MGCPGNTRYQEAQPGPQVLPAQDNIQNTVEAQKRPVQEIYIDRT